MTEEKIIVLKYSEIKNIQDALEKYKHFQEMYLELRLSSKQREISNYAVLKNILKRNIARVMTYMQYNNSI